jgi:lipopolysaccharide exporter
VTTAPSGRTAPTGNSESPSGKPKSAPSVRSGAIWNLGSTLLLRMTGIVLTAVVAHILSPGDFGVFAVAATAFAIISALGEFGVSSCLVRADLDVDALAPTMAAVSLTSSVLLAGAMVFWARPIAAILGSANAADPVKVMALTVILVGIFAVPTAQCMRDFRQDRLFLANVLSFIPSTALLLILAKSGSGAMAFAWSRLAGQAAAGIVVAISVRKNYLPGLSRDALAVLYDFGIPMAAANLLGFILLNGDYALVGRQLGAKQLGTYVLAFNIASWSSALLSSVINSVSIPAFSRVKHDAKLLRSAIDSGVRAVAVVAMPMCALLVVISRPLVLTVYGVRWEPAAKVLSVLSIYGVISIICLLFAGMLTGLGRSKFVLAVQVVWLAALFPAMTFGVHRGGIVGAALAHIVVIGPIVLPCYLIALKRATGIPIAALVKGLLPSLAAAVVAGLAAWLAVSQFSSPPLQLIAGVLAGGLLYAIAIAPHAVVVLLREKTVDPRVKRILRVYYSAGRIAGFQVGTLPRHARSSPRARGVNHRDELDVSHAVVERPRWVLEVEWPEPTTNDQGLHDMTTTTEPNIVEHVLADRPSFHKSGTARWDALPKTLEAVRASTRPGDVTFEVGVGVSTVIFAAMGAHHTAISPDPSEHELVREYCHAIGVDDSHLKFAVGFSDDILPSLLTSARTLDVALVDGAHSFPIPIVDWHYVTRALKVGGKLLLDDIPVPVVSQLFRHMTLEPNWRLDGVFDNRAAAFTMLAAPGPDDDWLHQPYNARYPDYSFVPLPGRMRLRAEYRLRDTRRAMGGRYPALRRMYRRKFGQPDA